MLGLAGRVKRTRPRSVSHWRSICRPHLGYIDPLGDESIMRSQSRLGWIRVGSKAVTSAPGQRIQIDTSRMPRTAGRPFIRTATGSRAMRLLIAAGACLIAASGGVLAQGFPWPFGGSSQAADTARAGLQAAGTNGPGSYGAGPRSPAGSSSAGRRRPTGRNRATRSASSSSSGSCRKASAIQARTVAQDSRRICAQRSSAFQVRASRSSTAPTARNQFLFSDAAAARANAVDLATAGGRRQARA